MGHICKKYIKDKYLIDQEIKLNSIDKEEIEANQVANKIIFNTSGINYYKNISIPYFSGAQLAKLAKNYSAKDSGISPQSIIMNYSWHKAEDPQNIKSIVWATAYKALKIVGENFNTPK